MKNNLLEVSPFASDARQLIGRDPRKIPAEDWRSAGVERQTAMEAIRSKCYECSGYDWSEVRKCTAVKCPLWPLRTGSYSRGLKAASSVEVS
jgi:hypothetical protein